MIGDNFSYRLTALAQPDDDGEVSPEAQGGSCVITLPFEADEDALLEVALEQIGIFRPEQYSIETTDTAGFCIRDADGEAVITLELIDDTIVDDDYDAGLYDPDNIVEDY